ncbi:RagB/SusD family nutrient uptake outer membrane protein [Carboxylicivirga marina]|uniref:RagB/SusD family nutrient uptake outer membrane protein n=1 Tax=Carboxylicivirga marina TaxID=2800988 RepID=A0ABS1HFL8_9BACT|nr:RagB/SusD family nutrient uptake outer membrane protein [Carboxylicivirga marina]MBK3516475.1 RagB/SusD family nutrient uptake outer membrane protein [Carboxylicivirga marina]
MKFLDKYIKIVVAAAIIGSTVSCSDEFLDTKPETAVSYEEAFESLTNAESALVGMYNNLSSFSFDGLYAPIMGDLVGEDILLDSKHNWNWFLEVYQLETLANYTWASSPWSDGYFLIYQANQIIENADKVPDATVAEKGNLKGQAKVMRAATMLKLVQMYGEAYSVNPEAPGILNANSAREWDEEDIGRSSVREIYGQILKDLNEAIPMLEDYANLSPNERSQKFNDLTAFFNVRSANAFLARVYLDMAGYEGAEEDYWEKARDHAAVAKKDMVLMDLTDMFSGFSFPNSETIYSIKYTADDNNVFLSIPSFYYPFDGYRSVRVDADFLDTFSAYDQRRKYWFADGRELIFDWPWDDTPEAVPYDEDNFVVMKFNSIGFQTGYAERISIRASEMYLIEAECEYELGNEDKARELLFAIQQRAQPGVDKSINTGENLIKEILLERRKELVGEGFRWNDIKRRSLPFKREGDHWSEIRNFQFGDEDYYRLTFPIPQNEIDNNSALTEADQNPGY